MARLTEARESLTRNSGIDEKPKRARTRRKNVMTDTFLEDHMAGKHQAEIVALMEKMESCFVGHSRAIIMFALIRSMAAMLGPAKPETRAQTIAALPKTLTDILARMDEALR
jgi:hypothetical protein